MDYFTKTKLDEISNKSILDTVISAKEKNTFFGNSDQSRIYSYLSYMFFFSLVLSLFSFVFFLSTISSTTVLSGDYAVFYSEETVSSCYNYLTGRFLNIIPIAWTVITLYIAVKTLVTKKCPKFYKKIGLNLENLILLNLSVLFIGFTPFLLEILIYIFVLGGMFYAMLVFFSKIKKKAEFRFSEACDICIKSKGEE